MNGGGDVFTTLMWGLRKYAWIVVLFVVGIGVLIPVLQSRAADVYEARAQVGPIDVINLPNLDPLPRLGDSVFGNGAVAASVRNELGLPSSASVVPERVQLVTAQDNIVFTVIGRGPTAESASKLANLAAATFMIELNKYSSAVGDFSIQRPAGSPAKPVSTLAGGYFSIVLGLIAGGIAGLGAVALLLVLRRPVVDASGAEEATGAPVLGRVRLPRGGGEVDERDLMGIALLCRRLLWNAPDIILLAGPTKAMGHLSQLGSAMDAFLRKVRGYETEPDESEGISSSEADTRSDDGRERSGSNMRPKLVVLDGPSLEQWAQRPDDSELTLLMVPKGIRMRSLRTTAEAYFTGGQAGLVIVEKHGRRRLRKRRLGATAPEQSLARKTSKDMSKEDDGHSHGKKSPEKDASPLRQ